MNLRLFEKHITQLQFGKPTSLSQVHVSRVLGGYERFSPEKALRVAEVTNFEVTPHELLLNTTRIQPTVYLLDVRLTHKIHRS